MLLFLLLTCHTQRESLKNFSLAQQHQLSAEQGYFEGDNPNQLSGESLAD